MTNVFSIPLSSSMIYDRPYTYLVIAALLLAIGIFGLLRRRTLIGPLRL